VVVLDLEAEATQDFDVRAAFDNALAAQPAEMVILGNLRQDQVAGDQHVIPKPYYYGPLIQMIEQLVNNNDTVHA
jgi:hypothetical protein